MRIIHTADWHLCDRLGRIDRADDLQRRVEIVAGLCEQERADVLVVAGDLFSEQASNEQMTAALHHLHGAFAGFFAGGGTLLAITGNHDRDHRIDLVRSGMRLAVPADITPGAELPRGRLYLQNGTGLVRLRGANETVVQFALVPYPTQHRYLQGEDRCQTREQEHRLLHSRVADWLAGVPVNPGFDSRLPGVVVAHLHVRGAEVHSLYRLTEADDIVFEPAALPTAWHYCALGHVHKPQAINGMDNVRYPGSLDRLDFGEKDDPRGVLLVEIDPARPGVEPRWLPIEPTPFLDVTLTDPAKEIPQLRERYPRYAEAIVRVRVERQGEMSRDAIGKEVRAVFPRCKDVTWPEEERPAAGLTADWDERRADLPATVRGYLNTLLTDDPDREALLDLAETFLKEEDTP